MSAPSKSDPMGLCPESEVLSLFLLGRLEENHLEAVGTHLADCSICQEVLDQINHNLMESNGDALLHNWHSHEPDADEVTNLIRLRSKLIDLRKDTQESTTFTGDKRQQTTLVPMLPRQLGQYELHECLGRGAMGIVFKAWHVKLKRPMALKLLLPIHRNDSQFQKRFEREMETIGKLSDHPHIVRASDAAEENGWLYLVMDYVEGCDLSTLLARVGRVRIADACEMVRQAALGLDHAHKHGILHRDVKPSNLLLTTQGQVKVLDMGLAIFQEDLTSIESFFESPVGTADYMAPELWKRVSTLGVESDVYSLGCTLFKLLLGHAPYSSSGRDTKSKKKAHLYNRVPSACAERPTIPTALDNHLRRMLAKNPRERFSRMVDVATALEPFAEASNLKSLADKVHNEHSDTQPVANERTLAIQVMNSIKFKGLGRMSRRVLLVCILFIVAALIVLLTRWVSPRMEVLLTQDSARLLWNYERSKDLIHIQSQDISMISVDNTTRTSGVIETRIIPTIGKPDAGVFYGYHADLRGGRTTTRFDMVGIKQDPSGTTYELYLASISSTQLDGGINTWLPVEHGSWKVTFDKNRRAIDLKLHFQEGKLRSVWCDDVQIRMSIESTHGSRQTAKPIGVYGVFNRNGASKLKRPQLSEDY